MSHAIAMVAIAFAVVAANILFTKLIFGRQYDDAPKREKIMMDVLSFGVMVALFLIYIVLISNL
jgi:heme/copper-type cytochrome/quinol oxidase subunit 1